VAVFEFPEATGFLPVLMALRGAVSPLLVALDPALRQVHSVVLCEFKVDSLLVGQEAMWM